MFSPRVVRVSKQCTISESEHEGTNSPTWPSAPGISLGFNYEKDPMTRNNLKDHISWLLESRSFIPPGPGPMRMPTKSAPSTPTLSQEILEGRKLSRWPENFDSILRGASGRDRASVEFAKQSSPRKPVPQGRFPGPKKLRRLSDNGSMARLQSAPRSASKPQLLTQLAAARAPKEALNTRQPSITSAIPDTKTVPESLSDRYNAQFKRGGDSQGISPPRRTLHALKPGVGESNLAPDEWPTPSKLSNWSTKVETIDLTGGDEEQTSSPGTVEAFGQPRTIWREDSASREAPLVSKGKKRKSDEFQAELSSRVAKSRAKVTRINHDVNSLPPVDSMIVDSHLDEAPPPYSTIAPPRAKPVPVTDDYEEHIITETRTRTETRRKRKSVSRVRSGNEEALELRQEQDPVLAGADAATMNIMSAKLTASSRLGQLALEQQPPSSAERNVSPMAKRARRQHQNIVPNSDDEDEEDDPGLASELWDKRGATEPEIGPPEHSDSISRSSPAQDIKPVPGSKTYEQGPGIVSSEASEDRKHPSASLNSASDRKNSQASPFQCDSPTKFANAKDSSSERDAGTCEPQGFIVALSQRFLGQSLPETKFFMSRLEDALKEKKRAALKYIKDGLAPPENLTEERKRLMKQCDGMSTLLSLKQDYIQLAQLEQELDDKLLEAFDNGEDMEELKNELSGVTLSLRQKGTDITQFIQEAQLSAVLQDIQGLGMQSNSPTDVVVRSTQLSWDPFRKQNLAGPSSLSHTQIVRQTQMTPVTPSKMLKTEEGYSKEALIFSPLAKMSDKMSMVVSPDPLRTSNLQPNLTEVGAYFPPRRTAGAEERGGVTGLVCSAGGGSHWNQNLSTPSRYRHQLPRDASPQQPNLRSQEVTTSRDDADYGEDWDEEELNGFMKTMAPVNEDDDDYEQYGSENDEDFLEAESNLVNDRSFAMTDTRSRPREVFAETSGNFPSNALASRSQTPRNVTASSVSALQGSMMQHRWSNDVKAAMKQRFQLRGFRQNQLEAINATLAGKDVFVLMPTGGGKSLCYQLPSIINSGKTRGVTVVVSPLLSLMQDQVDHLRELKIQAFLFNGEVTPEHKKLIMSGLRDRDVEKKIQLLYVTPEMITKNQALVSAFLDLHNSRKLARIVIDEAHCVSQWGHDFRPDYKAIGEVRKQFTGVPVMALTATATENVKVDVIHNLYIKGCEIFTQSFNRPNLTYEIRKKGKDKEVLQDIAQTIKAQYKNQSGIVYCLSRANCEKLAESLRTTHKIKAHHYHAGMQPEERVIVQKEWQEGRYNVIVATIAFGMGIDKADVRFVFHHTMPKSLEGYYQETGRAGRDGKRSGCYLYYGYRDSSALKRMIDDGDGSPAQKERQREMLRRVVQFCENRVDCRRVQVLAYFNEKFESSDCNNGCDNCTSTTVFEDRDLTKYAARAVELVQRLGGERVTLLQCVDVFRGSRGKTIKPDHAKMPEFGAGADLEIGEAERLFYRLLSEDAFKEFNVSNKAGFIVSYIKLGNKNKYEDYIYGKRKLKIQVRVSPKAKSKIVAKPSKRGTGVASAARAEYPQSTNISSPVQQAHNRRKARGQETDTEPLLHLNGYLHNDFVVSDDNDDEDSDEADGFEPVRVKGRGKQASQRTLSAPITTDKEMDALNPIHQDIVESFLRHAKDLSEEIRNKKGLRAQPFSDKVLRRMAIHFPTDQGEMLQIEDIDPEKVRRFGGQFLKLIKEHFNQYQSIMVSEEDSRYNKPLDPNHENVVIIDSDEEDEVRNVHGGDHLEEQSRFFPDPEAEAFNSQFAHFPNAIAPHPADYPFSSREGSTRDRVGERGRGNASGGNRRPRKQLKSGFGEGGKSRGTKSINRKGSSGSLNNASGFPGNGRGRPRRPDQGGRRSFQSNTGGGGRGINMMPY